MSIRENTVARQQVSGQLSADAASSDVPSATVVRAGNRGALRVVVVACPYCRDTHLHEHPGNLGAPVGTRPAPCRVGAFYRPVWPQDGQR
jgi:hypothetical protein